MLVRLPVKAASSRLIHCHRHVRRPIVRVVAFQAVRTYATPGRPKSVVGETSKPVKRATSRARATSTSANTKSTRSTAKKPATKKPAAKKPAAKKPAPKKAAPKKKTKPVKKTLTEEQQAAKKERLLKQKASAKKKADLENIKALKQQALTPPVALAVNRLSAYNLYVAGHINDSAFDSKPIPERMTELAKRYSALSASEKEAWNKRAEETRTTRGAELKKWIESHTAAEIGAANSARARLNRIYPVGLGKSHKYPAIPDERLPKRATSAWVIFFTERQAGPSGEFAKLTLGERMARIRADYKALSLDQRKALERQVEASRSAYEKTYLEVYGKAAPPSRSAIAAPA